MKTIFFVVPFGFNLPFNDSFLVSCLTTYYLTRHEARVKAEELSKRYCIEVLVVKSVLHIETSTTVTAI